MECKQKGIIYFFSAAFIAASFISSPVFSQTTIRGRVVYEKDNKPVAYASVELLKQKEGSLTDRSGFFSLRLSRSKREDTLLVSMVGYETLKIPVSAALNKAEFILSEKAKNLENVTVKSFSTHDVQGSISESVGFYRSWNTEKTGGEIGRIFKLPYKEYKIDKIRFKVSNMCDTCLIRLHIREVTDDKPGEEILKDSITMIISKLTLDDKAPEFDLRNYDFTFKQDEIFVSFEVLRGRSAAGSSCYFSFAGTEKGEYIYKSRAAFDWQNSADYTIYLKLFMRY